MCLMCTNTCFHIASYIIIVSHGQTIFKVHAENGLGIAMLQVLVLASQRIYGKLIKHVKVLILSWSDTYVETLYISYMSHGSNGKLFC